MSLQSGPELSQGDEHTPPVGSLHRLRERRSLVFRVAALCFPVVIVFVAEFGLRLVGSGSAFPLVESRTGSSYLNPSVDGAYCREELRGPEPREFVSPRPDDEIRILVVGESSVWGYPFSSELSFPRQMECLLAQQYPERNVKVLNAGIVGLSSLPISDLVTHAADVNPSMMVLYCGHNEFYGAGGVSTNSPLSSLQIQLSRSRLVQFFSRKPGPDEGADNPDQRPLISRMPKELAIPFGSPLIELAGNNYRNNVTKITRFCGSRNIPLLLVSPVSNLRGQSPMPLPEQRERLQEIASKVAGPLTADNAAVYLPLLNDLLEKNSKDAALHFRIAQCYELLGRCPDAHTHYSSAREFDPCRYRAISQFSDILKDVAESSSGQAEFMDIRDDFDAASRQCVPGDDLFLEHVHFTLDGHWLMARLLARAVVDKLTPGNWDDQKVPTLKARDEWLGIIPEDELVGYYLAYYLCQSFPLDQALDATAHQVLLKKKLDAARERLGEDRAARFDTLPHTVQIDDLVDGLGREFLAANDFAQAEQYFRRSITRRPWMANGYLYAAVCRYKVGDAVGAENLLRQSLRSVIPPTPRVLNDQQKLRNILRQAQ